MPRCANCGRAVSKDDSYKLAVFTGMSFCCENCADEYKASHPKEAKFRKTMLKIQVLVFLIILLVAIFAAFNKGNQEGTGGSVPSNEFTAAPSDIVPADEWAPPPEAAAEAY